MGEEWNSLAIPLPAAHAAINLLFPVVEVFGKINIMLT